MEIEKEIRITCNENELIDVLTKQLGNGYQLTYISTTLKTLERDGEDYKKFYNYYLCFIEKEE